MGNKGGGIFSFLLALVFRVVGVIWNRILRNFCGSQKGMIPKIENKLFLNSATDLAAKIRQRKLKSVDVVQAYISRIKAVNPIINAIVDERFEEALKDAKYADDFIETSGKSEEQLAHEKPLLGVPFSVKNAIGVTGMIMDSGVLAKRGTRPKENSVVVENMKNAGAIPLCVTNVSEACLWFDSSCLPYGRTKNPYDLTRISGGSSGGEAALISAAGGVIGLGNDLGGSIRIPSYCCGLFGHKPTRKIVSNQGQFPSSYRTDLDKYNVTGPICRYATDLQPVYKVLTGVNLCKLRLGTPVDMSNVKIFYTNSYPTSMLFSPIKKEMKEVISQVVKHFEDAHGVKAQCVELPVSPNKFTTICLSKLRSAKSTSMEAILTNDDKPINILIELLKWFLRLGSYTLHTLWYLFYPTYFEPNTPDIISSSNLLTDKLDEGLRQILGENGVLLYPPQPEPAYFHQELIFKFYSVSYTAMFNILGFPVTQCPTGLSKDGLPLGVQVVATHFNDHLTIAVAEEIERVFGGWKSPAPINV